MTDIGYEALNPWADVDPVKLTGISPRLSKLEGKTLGLLYNFKNSARPILTIVESKLKKKFPTLKISWYPGRDVDRWKGWLGEPDDINFRKWVKGVDAVIAAIGH